MWAESMAGGTSASVGTRTGAVRLCVVCAVCSCGLSLAASRPGPHDAMSRHSERAPIPSFPHLKDSSGCGLWVVRCAVSAVCAPCARVCLSAAPRFES